MDVATQEAAALFRHFFFSFQISVFFIFVNFFFYFFGEICFSRHASVVTLFFSFSFIFLKSCMCTVEAHAFFFSLDSTTKKK